jgi:glycine/D-amino acid oxidase-like deaminating enzyme
MREIGRSGDERPRLRRNFLRVRPIYGSPSIAPEIAGASPIPRRIGLSDRAGPPVPIFAGNPREIRMSPSHDVIIVGGGPAGLFAAFHLCEHANLRVLLIEKGHDPRKRKCPVNEDRGCLKCQPCNILCGIGGAGLFSDGKLNYIPKLGKTDLYQFMGRAEARALIDETEAIYDRFGMDGPVYPTDMAAAREYRKQAKRFGIDLLLIKQKHLGSDALPGYIADLSDHIRARGVAFRTGEEVLDILVENERVRGVVTGRGEYLAPNVILAPGRVGADWVGRIAQAHGINLTHRGIEVGVRVEVHNDILQDLTRSSTIRPSSSRPGNTTTRPGPSAPTTADSWPRRTTRTSSASTATPTGQKVRKQQLRLSLQGGPHRTGHRQPGLRRSHRQARLPDRRRQTDPAALRRSQAGPAQHLEPDAKGLYRADPDQRRSAATSPWPCPSAF